MIKRKALRPVGICASLACLGLVGLVSTKAGTATFDFQTDPNVQFLDFEQKGTSLWIDPANDPTFKNNGYIEVTSSQNSQKGVILMPDIDQGLPVRGFTFQCDLRIGGGTENPADGFSLNYARSSDPVIADILAGGSGSGFAASPGGEANLPEEGTQTGMGIGFDTWDSGGGDVVGISVRVDNTLVTQKSLPTRHGSVTDVTSLQTGPRSPTEPDNPYVQLPLLGWAPLKVDLTVDGKLSVFYKGAAVIENFQTTFVPSAGRLIFAGRTGDAREFHQVDNIQLTTIPATNFIVSGLSGNAVGVEVTFTDIPASGTFAGSLLDTNTMNVTLNGNAVTPTGILQSGLETKVIITLPAVLAANSINEVKVIAKDKNGLQITEDRQFVVGNYSMVPPKYAVDASKIDTSKPGFKVRVHQMAADNGRGTTDAGAERELAGLILDAATGQPAANIADLTGSVNGVFTIPTWINWGQPVDYTDPVSGNVSVVPEAAGSFQANATDPTKNFPEVLIPGMTSSAATDNYVAEIITYLDLKKGLYRFGFNSDDGFKVQTGINPKDVFSTRLGIYDGGKGSSDVLFDFYVQADGIYPFRAIYYEGGGGANAEFFAVDINTGAKYLIGDPNSTVYAKPYSTASVGLPVFVQTINPTANQTGVAPDNGVTVTFEDAGTLLDAGSVAVSVNGTAAVVGTPTKVGNVTTVKATTALLPSGSTNNVVLVYSDNSTPKLTVTNAWSFVVGTYATLPSNIARAVGSGTVPGFKVKVQQAYLLHDNGGFIERDGVRTPNLIEFSEQQLAGLWTTNIADLTDTNYPFANGYFTTSIVNWNRDANGIGVEQGSFQSPDWPDAKVPGIPSISLPNELLPDAAIPFEDFTMEILTYVEFPTAGYYKMSFNSDDGFKVTATEKGPDVVGPLKINEPADLAGYMGAISASPENGGGAAAIPTTPLTLDVVAANPIMAETELVNTNAVAGKIVYIERGVSSFADKVHRAVLAGAAGVIIANNRPDANLADGFLPIVMGSITDNQIPVVMITKASGDKLKAKLNASVKVTATMAADTTTRLGLANVGKGASDVDFGFVVPKAGLYPMRAVYFQGGGGANAEWFSYTSAGAKALLNSSATGALKTYTVAPAVSTETPTVAAARSAGKVVITYVGTLQEADKPEGPYTDVVGAAKPYEVTPAGTKFYKARN